MTKKLKGVIENWEIRERSMPMSMVLVPTRYLCIYGQFDGGNFRTSEIIGIDKDTVETRNSFYKLGKRRVIK